MKRQRRGALEWAVLIDEWNASGLKLPEFCRRRELSRGTMQGWVYKPALKQAIETARRKAMGHATKASQQGTPVEPNPSPAFLPVRLAETPAVAQPPTDRAAIEVVLGAGRRVAVAPGFDEETLRRVVAALESTRC
jgi:transposase